MLIKNKIWTEEEIQFLKDNVDKMRNSEIAKALNRTLDSVKMKIRYNKIIRKNFKASIDFIEGEKWKTIKEAPDYKISNFGRVCNAKENHLMQTTILPLGYVGINLSINGKRTPFRVHRLVAKYFIPNPENKPEVNHKDGNKTNNHVDNLEWMTSHENHKHAYDNNLMKPPKETCERHSKASLTNEQVHEICKLIQQGYTNNEISEKFNIQKRNIVSQIRRRKTWIPISKNYEW